MKKFYESPSAEIEVFSLDGNFITTSYGDLEDRVDDRVVNSYSYYNEF